MSSFSIKKSVHLFWIGNEIALCCLTTTNTALAQIIPDTTLPSNSSIITQGNVSIITGGTVAGKNLFHSFKEFSVVSGSSAYFNNAPGVQNILTRVTGSSVSIVDGLIRANNTNLFLLNPNGIIFGPNASLNIGGSFLASTASSLKFEDGAQFSAIEAQTIPMLTVSVPLGLQFGTNAGNILVQGSGLRVRSEKTLALVGGEILVQGGARGILGETNLAAPRGRIELGSVADNSLVRISPTIHGWILEYGGVQNFKDIQLSQTAFVATSASGGGDIQVQGRHVALTNGSEIQASTLGSLSGGTLAVTASESVELRGTTADGQYGSALVAQTEGTGSAGNLIITTRKLIVEDGASVIAGTLGRGFGGTLSLAASESVELTRLPTTKLSTGLFNTVEKEATGASGDLTLLTGRLIVRGGAQIATATRSLGKGGTLTVTASQLVELSGTSSDSQYPSALSTTVQEGARGDGGNLTLTTRRLIVQDGAQIQAATLGRGAAGTLEVNASEWVVLIGESAQHQPSGLFTVVEGDARGIGGNLTLKTGWLSVQNGAQISSKTDGRGAAGNMVITATKLVELRGRSVINRPSILTAQTKGAGSAGDLTIETGQLMIRDGGQVIVSSTNQTPSAGLTGNLNVTARSILLDNQGKLSAESNSVQGGNITLKLQDLLLLRRNSQISTTAGTAQAGGNGGNITINAPFIVAVPSENSDISANAFSGQGGNVTINSNGIFGIQRQEKPTLESDVTASSELGVPGTVQINTLDLDPSRGLVQLSTEPVNVEVAQGCQAGGKQSSSVAFFNTGKGGLAVHPYEPLSSSNIWEDVPAPDRVTNGGTRGQKGNLVNLPDKIVEAQGWITNKKGEVLLVAEIPATDSQNLCRFR